MGNDGESGNDAKFGALQEGSGNQNAINKVVKSITDQNEQARTPVIMGRRLGIVRFAMVMVAMPPKHQFFENEKSQYAEQDGCRHLMWITMLQRMWNDLKEGGPKQRTDGIGNQQINALSADADT